MCRKNHELSPQLYLYLFVILEENSKQNCFACLLLQILLEYVDITKLKERNMSCTSTGLQVHSLPSFHYQLRWRPPKHHTLKSVQSIHNKTVEKKRKHSTVHDLLGIVAMLHFGGKGDSELTLSYAINL